MFEFEFIPDYWQDEWNPDDTTPFIAEYEYEDGDSSVGLAESFNITLMYKGVDITHTLNSLNEQQLLKEVQDHFTSHVESYNDYDVSEHQEWHDFNPDC